MTVSGTISSTLFTTRKVIDNAFRQCRLGTQIITSEMIMTALEQLYLLLSDVSGKGIPLWCIEKKILPMYQGQFSVVCPQGTYDSLNLSLRTLQRLSGAASASQGTAANAFDGDLDTSCTQVAAGGTITLDLDAVTDVPIIGILPKVSGTWSFVVETSEDGAIWTTVHTATGMAVTAGQWVWADIAGSGTSIYAAASTSDVGLIRIRAIAPTILDLVEFVVGNMPTEIDLSLINRDDYENLPNKFFQGRPTQYWFDRQRDEPIITLWPAPDLASTFRQLILTRQRRIMDVGTLTQTLDIPQEAFNPIVAILAWMVALRVPEVKVENLPLIEREAMKAERTLWDGQSDRAPVRITPNIRCYTR
jgi:hypothetical protein